MSASAVVFAGFVRFIVRHGVCLAGFLAPAAALSAASAAAEADVPPFVGPVLYIFAHQDDELFILRKMTRDVARGCTVHAVWITNGDKRGSAERRNAEARAVMARIGVPAENLHFLGFPDQESIAHLPAVLDQVQALAARVAFREITSPAYEGGHIDHDVAALVAAMVRRSTPDATHFEYPLYNRHEGRNRVGVFLPNADSPVRYVRLDDPHCARAHGAHKLYRSQRLLLAWLSFKTDRKTLRAHGEPHREAPRYDFLQRPTDEPCRYEVTKVHRSPFSRWLDAVQPMLATPH